MESNPITECHSYQSALNSGASFAKAVGCDPSDSKCLRNVPADTVKSNSGGGGWEATIDGTVGGQNLPDYPLNLVKQGKYNRVPTILGTNKNEEALFVALVMERPLNASAYEALIQTSYPKNYQQVLALYPAEDNYDNRITYGYLLTHQNWACPGAQMILNINKYNPQGSGGYIYYFEHIDSFPNWHEPICKEAVCHGEELAFVWNTVDFVSKGLFEMTPEEKALTKSMQTYWGQFSATGVPSTSGQVNWPTFLSNTNTSMVLDTPNVYTSPGHIQKYCNLWDTISVSNPSLRLQYRLQRGF